MAKWRIIYKPGVRGEGEETEEVVEADHFLDQENGKWIDFEVSEGLGSSSTVLRVRAEHVDRVERMES